MMMISMMIEKCLKVFAGCRNPGAVAERWVEEQAADWTVQEDEPGTTRADLPGPRLSDRHAKHRPVSADERVRRVGQRLFPLQGKITYRLLQSCQPLRLSWWRSTVVERWSLIGELSLSCAWLLAGWMITFWVRHPLSVSQHGQLSHPSLRGR